jgi:hypothetical protein
MDGVAEIYGCSPTTIKRMLVKQNVEIRPSGRVGAYKNADADSIGFMIGMLLGDSCFVSARNHKHINTEHSLSQEKYLVWKINKTKDVFGEGRIYCRDRFDSRTNKMYHSVSHHSLTHPAIDWLYSEFFKGETKQVTVELLEKLTPEGIAIWFCDDGNLYRYPKGYLNQLTISTNAFDSDSRSLILNMFKEKYGLKFSVTTQGAIRMCNMNGIRRFYTLFGNYIPQCMNYKKMVNV